jgi:hypothetical protein
MIISNHHSKELLYHRELTTKEQLEYEPSEFTMYFRYKGWVYSLDDFMGCVIDHFKDGDKYWHGSLAESAFSGVVIRLESNGTRVRVGTWRN